ncbi:MAG: EAL domain-containing protein [Oscillospiraceae bacterium]|nr:EAL domain-containing protein [Oscillospiraceae bacterium]
MKQIWHEIFGQAWDELLSLSPEIGGYVADSKEHRVMLDRNAMKLLGMSEEPTYETMLSVVRSIAEQKENVSPLSVRQFSMDNGISAGLIKLNKISSSDARLCSRGGLMTALVHAKKNSMLAMIEVQSFEGLPSPYSVVSLLNAISESEPAALVSRCGKRRYWLFIPEMDTDCGEYLTELQRNALESIDDVTFTAGCADPSADPLQRMNTAEFMLYQANAMGKGTVLGYSRELYEKRHFEYDKAKRFTQLVDENLFVYNFQPIVSSHNGSIYAYETLMRTESSINLSPEEVIETAARCNRLYDVERCTMRNALRDVANHMEEFADKKMFVNSISAHILSDEDWGALEHTYGDVMKHIVIELTEQTEVAGEKLMNIKERLNKSGIELAIDDYGTGYSNTSNLLRYSPDYVKIDRALINGINKKPKIQQLVSSIIEFIHSNGFKALAEGVETYDEMKVMIQLGADLMQGFYTAHPRPYLQSSISENVVNEIIRINTELSSVSRYYHPADHETINLFDLAARHYSAVFIDSSDVTIQGGTENSVNVPIVIKDGIKTKLTLCEAVISNDKESAIITLGDNSEAEIELVGSNKLLKRGINVPVTSSLRITGAGSLDIQASSTSSYGIGSDRDSGYGNITIACSGKVSISSFGDTSVGIGGGRNDAGSRIRFESGDVRVTCEGTIAVGVGAVWGNCIAELKNCVLSVRINSANSIGVGSYEGYADIELCNFRCFVDLSGAELCGIGVKTGGTGNVYIADGSVFGDFHGRSINCIGTENGKFSVRLSNSDLKIECGGNSITGIGDSKGSGDIDIKCCKLDMTLLSASSTGIATNGNVCIVDTIDAIKTTE